MMMSEKASSSFVSFDLANRASKPGDQRLLGWGAEWPSLPWGSYGFASLSMGRDRYRETDPDEGFTRNETSGGEKAHAFDDTASFR